jgi:2-oxoisovalerate dehydrogenase E1 component
VFTLTKKLSTDFPGRVFNSPLAESTILGVACGLASYGRDRCSSCSSSISSIRAGTSS